MKCYLVVLCGVFLNANSHSFDYYSDEYETILEDSLPNNKERNDEDPYTGLNYTNSNDLDLDVGSGSGKIEERILARSYKTNEVFQFIPLCPTFVTGTCNCPCACREAQDNVYYWRDYDGIIPEDALPAYRDIYIGQVYIEGKGTYVGRITPGVKEIVVSAYGVKKRNDLIKILCTQHKENFCFIKTTSTTFHNDVKDKSLVIGGFDTTYNKGELHVGLNSTGNYIFGSVTSFQPREVYLWYPKGNVDIKELDFLVLLYNKVI